VREDAFGKAVWDFQPLSAPEREGGRKPNQKGRKKSDVERSKLGNFATKGRKNWLNTLKTREGAPLKSVLF